MHRMLAGGVALAVAVLGAGIIAVAVHDGTSTTVSAGPNQSSSNTDVTGSDETSSTLTGDTVAPGVTSATRPGTRSTTGSHTSGTVPGVKLDTSCSPAKGYKATGIDETSIHVGQIVTDVSVLPAQLFPNREGLYSLAQAVNAAGGVCGRKIFIDYSNDNYNGNAHQQQYAQDVSRDFAFVANSSLIDADDYSTTPVNGQFYPNVKDGNEYVPDIGGLAYSYYRSQSIMHAGAIGSISPTLVGGGAFKAITDEVRGGGQFGYGPCRDAGVVYLQVPGNTASQDSAEVGKVALEASWGGNFGAGHVHMYAEPLAATEPQYEGLAQQMIADGVNCAFTYADLGSDITFVQGLQGQQVWPPQQCSNARKSSHQCFAVVYIPFAGYDPTFITKAGTASLEVSTFIPHPPFSELASNQALQDYARNLQTYDKGLEHPPSGLSTFSLIGYVSGIMFVEAVQSCGAAPTRTCVMDYLRHLQNFTAGGLLGGITPFRSTRVKCQNNCGDGFKTNGTFDFKWIFNCSIGLRVQTRDNRTDFYRYAPPSGYLCDDTLHVARGSPA